MHRMLVTAVGVAALTACGEEYMTYGEAREALLESFSSSRESGLTAEPIELTTSFTLGQAAQDAAEELRAWVESQVPCATVTRAGDTVSIDYGELGDDCVYNGHTYAGVHTVTIVRSEGEAQVAHTFVGLGNGELTLDGTADVTWSAADASRHVVHDFTWTDAEREVHATGDRIQRLLDPEAGLAGGISVNGDREWETGGRAWHLDIDGVEARGQDPVPQAGTYTVTNPDGKALTATFTRIDEDTIEVVLTGLRRARTWLVSAGGEIEAAPDES